MIEGAASPDAALPGGATCGTRRYFVPNHVHLCVTGNHVVFLDLRRDRYHALGSDGRRVLAAHVVGWPNDETCASSESDATHDLLNALVDRTLLTTNPALGAAFSVPVAAPPTQVLIDDGFARQRRTAPGDASRFAIACARAAASLRLCSLERTVHSIQVRKSRALARVEASTLERDRGMVSTFNRLRPFAFSADTHCLYDSLALLEFLASYGSYPCWVIGVCTNPFAAHSWLQQHERLFNGPIDHVARYTPILVV
jgi:Transglutaminase-like superfamily